MALNTEWSINTAGSGLDGSSITISSDARAHSGMAYTSDLDGCIVISGGIFEDDWHHIAAFNRDSVEQMACLRAFLATALAAVDAEIAALAR